MAYTSVIYLIILLLSGLLYYLAPKKARGGVLLTVSITFFVLSDLSRIFWLLLTALSVYFGALWMDKINRTAKEKRKTAEDKAEKKAIRERAAKQKKAVVTVGVLLNFGILAFLKYFNVLGSGINSVLGSDAIPRISLLVPLGISYYTLQAAGYLLDVYRGKYAADKNFGRVLLFLSFFPQMVEGPIARYDELADQLWQPHALDMENIQSGVRLFFWGLLKKLVIADRAALLVNEVFDHASDYGSWAVVLGAALYTLQIYADFAGCMDMVRGTGRIFGVHMAENFRQPFFSRTVQEFWQRWHITLGSWLKDYVFYASSLSGWFGKLNKFCRNKLHNYLSKVIPAAAALFPVWVFNGIWHGAGLKYFVYGMYYFGLMLLGMLLEPLIEKFVLRCRINKDAPWYRGMQILRTCVLVGVGMLIFRAPSLTAAWDMLLSVFTRPGNLTMAILDGVNFGAGDFVILAVSAAVLLAVGILREKGVDVLSRFGELKLPARWAISLAGLLLLVMLGAYGPGYPNSGFIYGQF